jgi:hypothetical protein
MGIASPTDTPKAARTLDISSLPAFRDVAEGSRGSGREPTISAAFLDDSTIAVFVQYEYWPDGSQNPRVYDTAVLTIDALNGTSLKSQVRKGSHGLTPMLYTSGIHPTGTSGFLINIGDELLSLSHDLEVVGRRELPLNRIQFNHAEHQDQWRILIDPRTKTALLAHFPFVSDQKDRAFGDGDAHWVSVETLEDKSSFPVPLWSGNKAALIGNSLIYGEFKAAKPTQIQINNQKPRPLCTECRGGVAETFGNGFAFLVRPNEYWVTNTTGTILVHKTGVGGRGDSIGGVSGGVTSNRVAFMYGHLGRRRLDETVVVLDVDANKEIWRLALHQEPITIDLGTIVGESFTSPRLALSPDGKRLAVISGTVLSIFEIP